MKSTEERDDSDSHTIREGLRRSVIRPATPRSATALTRGVSGVTSVAISRNRWRPKRYAPYGQPTPGRHRSAAIVCLSLPVPTCPYQKAGTADSLRFPAPSN